MAGSAVARLTTNFPRTGNEFAVEVTESSGIVAADGVILNNPGVLVAIIVLTDGSNNATAIIYDNASAATGKVLGKVAVQGADLMGGELKINALARNGLFLDISGTGAEALIRYID